MAWLLLGLYLFHFFQGSWGLFAVVFFTPDLSLIAYLFGPRKGAVVYNALHVEIGPILLIGGSVFLDQLGDAF